MPDIWVLGAAMTPFTRYGPDVDLIDLAHRSARSALGDGGVEFPAVDVLALGTVYEPSANPAQRLLRQLGQTGIPAPQRRQRPALEGHPIGATGLAGPAPLVPPAGPVTQYFTSKGVNESSDPTRFVAVTDLYSLASALPIGTAVDSVTCATSAPPPCAVLDVLTVFHYPAGEMTARSRISIVPDPQRPGFALVGTRPERDTVTEGTGAFAGRTGRLSLSGSVDMRNFPRVAPFEGVSVITFN